MRITADTIRTAVRSGDFRVCGKIADTLRLEHGFNYSRIYRMVANVTGISLADWDELMRQADEVTS